MKYKILNIREHKELIGSASEWFHSCWEIPAEAYRESMEQSDGENPVPQWYVAMDNDRIIAGLGVIENDFHKRTDLAPNVCAVYVDEEYRCRGIAGEMLKYVCSEMKNFGIDTLYLLTDHIGFYERYGWEYFCEAECDGGEISRLYRHIET